MNDHRYYTPEAQTIRSLCQKLDQENRRADSAEWNEELYRLAITYLKSHPFADEFMPDLYEYMDEVLMEKWREINKPNKN